jgi:hypothetical protein
MRTANIPAVRTSVALNATADLRVPRRLVLRPACDHTRGGHWRSALLLHAFDVLAVFAVLCFATGRGGHWRSALLWHASDVLINSSYQFSFIELAPISRHRDGVQIAHARLEFDVMDHRTLCLETR